MTPGSPVAKSCGCTCPGLRNNNGVGDLFSGELIIGPLFAVDGSCPMHGLVAWRTPGPTRSSGWDERPEDYGFVRIGGNFKCTG